MNGRLASDDPAAGAGLAELVDLDGRDRREVAGHERQHARRHHRDQPREERDRELLEAIEARELLVDAPLELGVERRAARRGRRPVARPVPRPHPRAAAEHDRADRDPGERQHPREQVEAVRPRDAEHGRAELGDERVLDLALRPALRRSACGCTPSSAARSASRTRRAACGRSGRRARPPSRSASGAARSRAPARRARAAAQADGERASCTSSALPDRPGRVSAFVAGPTMCPTRHRHDAAPAVDEERLRVPGDAVVADERPVVADVRVVDAEALR